MFIGIALNLTSRHRGGGADTTAFTADTTLYTADMGSVSADALRVAASPPLPQLAPSASWNGTAGTGWSGSEPAATASTVDNAPIVVWHERDEDGDCFTSNHRLHVHSECRGGVDRVEIEYEGVVFQASSRTRSTHTGGDGVTRPVVAYTFEMDHSAHAADGEARFYIRSVPTDGAMVDAVIGPYQIFRKTAYAVSSYPASIQPYVTADPTLAKYDKIVLFGPTQGTTAGEKYPSQTTALTYLRGLSTATFPNVCALAVESHAVARYNESIGSDRARGIVDVRCASGVTVTVSEASTTTAVNWAPGPSRLRFNRGYVINMTNINRVASGHQYPPRYLGVEFFGPGRDSDLFGDGVNRAVYRNVNPLQNVMMCECTWRDMYKGMIGSVFSRNNTVTNISEDAISLVGTNVAPSPFSRNSMSYGNVVTGHDSAPMRTPLAAATFTYTGSETTATISRSGGFPYSLVLATSAGTVATLATTNVRANQTSSGPFYDWTTLVAYVNAAYGAAGWAATLVSDTRRAAEMCGMSAYGDAFPSTNVKNVVATVGVAFDVHADFFQFDLNSTYENQLFANNKDLKSNNAQMFWLSQGLGGTSRRLAIINNIADCLDETNLNLAKSGISGTLRHLLMWHNTMANQKIYVAASTAVTFDSFCSISGNVFREFESTLQTGFIGTSGMEFNENHIMDGSAPTGATNSVTGGTVVTLLADQADDDFAPIGSLLSNKITPRVSYDVDLTRRAGVTPRGAVHR